MVPPPTFRGYYAPYGQEVSGVSHPNNRYLQTWLNEPPLNCDIDNNFPQAGQVQWVSGLWADHLPDVLRSWEDGPVRHRRDQGENELQTRLDGEQGGWAAADVPRAHGPRYGGSNELANGHSGLRKRKWMGRSRAVGVVPASAFNDKIGDGRAD